MEGRKAKRKEEEREERMEGTREGQEREAEVEGGQRLKPKLAAGIQHEGFDKTPTDLWGNPGSLLPFSALLNYLLSPPFLTLQTRCLTQAVNRQRIAELKESFCRRQLPPDTFTWILDEILVAPHDKE